MKFGMSFPPFQLFSKKNGKLLRLGIIGLGRISEIHIRTFLDNKNVSIESLADIRKDVVAQKASELGIGKFSTDYRRTLRDPLIDVVDILLPHYLHAQVACEALEAGKNVICEKPLALSLSDIDRIQRISQKTKKHVHVKHYFRYARLHRQLKDLLVNHGVGKPYMAHCLYTTNGIDNYQNRTSWKGDSKKAGGGVLIDTGFHMIDLWQDLFGNPLSVYTVCKRNFSSLAPKGENLSITVLEYPHNVMATLVCTAVDTSLGNRWEKRFFGSDGSIYLVDHGRDNMTLEHWRSNSLEHSEEEQKWWDKANRDALNDCIERIDQGRSPAVTYRESKSVLTTILQAYKSGRSGKKELLKKL